MANPAPAKPEASLSVIDGVAILVGIVIGIGIFKTPPLVAANVGSEAAFLGVWLLGGVLALIGALCYAELASAHPDAGGEYHFLTRAYGPSLGMLFAWARGTVIQTGAIAAVAFVFGDYANILIPLGAYGPSIHAVAALIAVTAVNLIGTMQGKQAQIVFTALTILAVAAVVAAGWLAPVGVKPPIGAAGGGGAGLAMVFILLTYGGWNEAAYLSGEMRDVQRNMARTLVVGVTAVIVVYMAVNFAYLNVFGLEGVRQSKAIAADLMTAVVGEKGALVLSLIVCVAAISTLNGTVFTGARTYYALGRDLGMLRALGAWQSQGDKPTNALLLQGAIALVLIGFGAVTRDGFEAMVAYTAPVFWFFLFLVGLSIYVFRWRDKDRVLPFRVPLYPITPAVFCLTCVWMLYSSLAYAGPGAIIGVLVLLAGTPLLLLRRRAGAKAKPQSS